MVALSAAFVTLYYEPSFHMKTEVTVEMVDAKMIAHLSAVHQLMEYCFSCLFVGMELITLFI
jgi:hypothetical protein